MPRETDVKQTLCADVDGFSLHAAVRCGSADRQALEQLCRYITRPALANERVQTNAAGQVVLKLKTPLARRHHAPGDVAAGVHAAAGGVGATAAAICAHRRPERPSWDKLLKRGCSRSTWRTARTAAAS